MGARVIRRSMHAAYTLHYVILISPPRREIISAPLSDFARFAAFAFDPHAPAFIRTYTHARARGGQGNLIDHARI